MLCCVCIHPYIYISMHVCMSPQSLRDLVRVPQSIEISTPDDGRHEGLEQLDLLCEHEPV